MYLCGVGVVCGIENLAVIGNDDRIHHELVGVTGTCHGLLVRRQPQSERGTHTDLRPHRAFTTVVLAHMLDDREAQARATRDPRASRINTVEALENALEFRWFIFYGLFVDRDLHDVGGESAIDGDARARRRVGNSIRE